MARSAPIYVVNAAPSADGVVTLTLEDFPLAPEVSAPSSPVVLTAPPASVAGVIGGGALRKATGQFYQLNSYSGAAGWKHAPLMVSDGTQWK